MILREQRNVDDEALGRRGLLKPIWFHEAPQVSRNVMQVSRQDREDCGKEEVTGPTIGTVYSESRDHRARDAKVLFEKGKEGERKKPRQNEFIHASAHSLDSALEYESSVSPEMSLFRDEFLRDFVCQDDRELIMEEERDRLLDCGLLKTIVGRAALTYTLLQLFYYFLLLLFSFLSFFLSFVLRGDNTFTVIEFD